MSKKLDRLNDPKEKTEQKLQYYQHQERMPERRIPELTNDQVMELRLRWPWQR